MNIACGIEYDGTDYHGFQRQLEVRGPTVQGVLEAAIKRISGEMSVVNSAGRTDAGVHASGQVISFKTSSSLSTQVWQRALNAVLPESVAVRWMREVPDSFHARFSAMSRSYCYTVWNGNAPSPLRGRYSYYRSQLIDVPTMHSACELLVGTRDFGAFGRSPDAANKPGFHSSVRTMIESRCERHESSIYFHFTANAFLTGMVRRMVGTLLLVGQGRLDLDEFATIVQRAEKTHPGSAAPPHGLCLVRVEYPEDFGVSTHHDEDI